MKNTLLLIFAFLALMIGSFIWFVATWDPSEEDPVSMAPASSWQIQLPPEGRSAASASVERKATR